MSVRPRFAMGLNHWNNIGRGLPKNHLCEIILKLDLGLRRRCFSELLTDGG